MKQYLRLMAMLWPKIRVFMCADPGLAPALPGLGLALGIMLCLNTNLSAQQVIKPLQIGDTIPEYLWHMPLQVVSHPEGKDTITLGDYKGKLIILDFWATWCTSCLRDFPKQDSLQQQFAEDLVLLRATYQTADQIKNPIYSIVANTSLRAFFPYRQIPHYVWVDASGRVVAITNGEALIANNVQQAVAEKHVQIKVKIDRDSQKPLLLDAEVNDSLLAYAILYEGQIDGYGSETIFRKTNGITHGRSIINRSILDLYVAALIPLFNAMGDHYSYKRNRVSANIDSQKFSVDLLVPKEQHETLYPYLLRLLNENSPYDGHIEKKRTSCLVLMCTDNSKIPVTQGGQRQLRYTDKGIELKNFPIEYLVNALNGHSGFSDLPMVNEVGVSDAVDISLKDITSLAAIQQDLMEYGLAITTDTRIINLFFLTPKS